MEIELILRGIERLIVSGSVPMLIYLGYRLFVLGASGEMQIIANKDDFKAKITNIAPGTFCFLLGVILGAYVMFSEIKIYDKDGEPKMSYYGGAGDSQNQLSWVIAQQYALAALQAQKTSSRPNVTVDEVKKDLNNTPLLKANITKVLFKDLLEIEAAAKAGNVNAVEELKQWEKRYLK